MQALSHLQRIRQCELKYFTQNDYKHKELLISSFKKDNNKHNTHPYDLGVEDNETIGKLDNFLGDF